MEENTVVLTVVSGEPEADMLCELLRANGIECGSRDTDAIETPLENLMPAGPREILVHANDLEAAQSVLAARDA
jgi:hypothetical protein